MVFGLFYSYTSMVLALEEEEMFVNFYLKMGIYKPVYVEYLAVEQDIKYEL